MENQKRLIITLLPENRVKLREMAEAEHASMSWVLNRLVDEAVEVEGE